MSGSREGGAKARETIKAMYGDTYYAEIGKLGGKAGSTGKGFGSANVDANGLTGKERAKIAGKAGGKLSRRGIANRKGSK